MPMPTPMRSPHAASPNLLDLNASMAMAADSICARLDETQDDRPWFYIKGRDGVPASLGHGSWDLGDMTGRYLESMVMARRMLGPRPEWSDAEERLLAFMKKLTAERGLVTDIDKGKPDHMFAQGSALFGLVAKYEDDTTRDDVAEMLLRFVEALYDHAIPAGDHLTYPDTATPTAVCSHMAGEQIVPLVRFYKLSGYDRALSLAEGLSGWALLHDPTYAPNGILHKIGWDGHFHAWLDTLAGAIQVPRSPVARYGVLDWSEGLIDRCRNTYNWIRSCSATDFGWVPDFHTSPSSETCAISSMIRLALELIEEGDAELWNDVERFTRNQLVENQFRGNAPLPIEDPRVAAALHGCFDCWALPNTLFANVRQWGKEDDGDVEGCCVNGGMRGIWMAWENAVTVDGMGAARVNLLIDREIPDLTVRSRAARDGVVELTVRRPMPVEVRLPDWVDVAAVRFGGEPATLTEDRYAARMLFPDQGTVELTFPVRSIRTHETVAGQEYECLWSGDSVVDITPTGEKYPTYQRG